MRFLTMIKTDESNPAGPPPASLIQAVGELGRQAMLDGTMLEQGGLLPTAAGALVRVVNGKVTVVDGPFAEAREVIGGYAMFQLHSKDEAIEMARRFMRAHAEHWPAVTAVCEVRQVAD